MSEDRVTASPHRDVRQTIVHLLSNMSDGREIRSYLQRFSEVDRSRFAVIKIGGAILAAIVALTIVVGGAVSARSRIPDLKPWHRLVPSAEVRASEVGPTYTLDNYLAREQKVFDEVRTQIEDRLAPEERLSANRYDREGQASPSRLGRDWNRTFEMAVTAPTCAAVLLHGLTDSPYSMRASKSWPRSSVPSGCSHEGPFRRAAKSMSLIATFQISGANRMARIIVMRMTPLATASL